MRMTNYDIMRDKIPCELLGINELDEMASVISNVPNSC